MRVAKNLIIIFGLLATAACTNTQTSPTMMDFSYVPPQYTGGGVVAYNTLEDF